MKIEITSTPDKDRLADFLYHLGKGLWKSVPILGPIIEEVFYEQFSKELKARVSRLSDSDIQSLLEAIPPIDMKSLDKRLGKLTDDLKKFGMWQTTALLSEIEQNHHELIEDIQSIHEKLEPLPNMNDILCEMRIKMFDPQGLKLALEEIASKRDAWVNRISKTQRVLLANIPEEYTCLSTLWDIIKRLVPSCVYKEFRFRLHELEWLGLARRSWNVNNETWMYCRTESGSDVIKSMSIGEEE